MKTIKSLVFFLSIIITLSCSSSSSDDDVKQVNTIVGVWVVKDIVPIVTNDPVLNQEAQNLKIGERKLIEAPAGTKNEIIMPDGSKKAATHIFIEVKPSGNTGTIHAFPVESGFKVTPRKGS